MNQINISMQLFHDTHLKICVKIHAFDAIILENTKQHWVFTKSELLLIIIFITSLLSPFYAPLTRKVPFFFYKVKFPLQFLFYYKELMKSLKARKSMNPTNFTQVGKTAFCITFKKGLAKYFEHCSKVVVCACLQFCNFYLSCAERVWNALIQLANWHENLRFACAFHC